MENSLNFDKTTKMRPTRFAEKTGMLPHRFKYARAGILVLTLRIAQYDWIRKY